MKEIVLTKKEDELFRTQKWTHADLYCSLQLAEIEIMTFYKFLSLLNYNNLDYTIEVGNEKYNTTETGY